MPGRTLNRSPLSRTLKSSQPKQAEQSIDSSQWAFKDVDLLVRQHWQAVSSEVLGDVCDATLELPAWFREDLLYGNLFASVRRPDLTAIFFSSQSAEKYLTFWKAIANKYEAEFVVVDSAASGMLLHSSASL